MLVQFFESFNSNFPVSQLLKYLSPKDRALLSISCKILFQYFSERPLRTLIGTYYSVATTDEQKKACRCFLLQYQHYNAEYTIEECERLKYPLPLYVPQKQSVYTRTGYPSPLFQLAEPWIKKNLTSVFSVDCKFIKLTTQAAKMTFHLFIKKENVIFIELNPNNLKGKTGLDFIPKQYVTKRNAQQIFVFLLQDPLIDCILMWGAKWRDKKDLEYVMLDRKDIFGKEVFSLLNETGAVPDRIALNAFLATNNYPQIQEAEVKPLKRWDELVKRMEETHFANDPGLDLFRKAILKWYECLKTYGLLEFALPLLSTQVEPWLLNNHPGIEITRWAKAYQNLCEIVFFCLQFHPEACKGLDLEQILLRSIPVEKSDPIYSSLGIFPYAMSAFLHVFNHLHACFEGKNIKISCVSQSYFETLLLLNELNSKKTFTFEEREALEEIEDLPEILIADIHPNNAARKVLYQNNLADWLPSKLDQTDKKLILILDITLNHISDPIIYKTFSTLIPFVKTGQLEIFAIQSLAKLVQLGADNFSGGACLYFGNQKLELNFPKPPLEKLQFFSLLHQNFQPLVADYFTQVRKNTDWMYKSLAKDFKGSSVAKITFNGDSNTVYVAIDFQPLLGKINAVKKDQDKFVKELRNLLLELADSFGLPITHRQSFGFSLSNMSTAVDSIRFSLGIENKDMMQSYANLIKRFHSTLQSFSNKFALLEPKEFVNKFSKDLRSIIKIINSGNFPESLFEAPLGEEIDNENGDEIWSYKGEAVLNFENHQLTLTVRNEDKKTLILDPYIRLHPYTPAFNSKSKSDLVELFYNIYILNKHPENLTIQSFENNRTEISINGIVKTDYLFTDEKSIVNEKSGGEIDFRDETYTLSDKKTSLKFSQLYVNLSELNAGHIDVNLTRLDPPRKDRLYEKCFYYSYDVVLKNELGKDCYVLVFTEEKPRLNYLQEIKKGWPSYFQWINSLDPKNLPIPLDEDWKLFSSSLDFLDKTLNSIGYSFIQCDQIHNINYFLKNIESTEFKKSVLNGCFECLVHNSLNGEKLTLEKAKDFAQVLDSINFQYQAGILENWLQTVKPDTVSDTDLIAFMPYLKTISLSDLENSIPLHTIAKQTDFLPLKRHLENLENGFIERMSKLMQPKLGRILNTICFYPFEEMTIDLIIKNLPQFSDDLLRTWILHPGFYFSPLDDFEYNQVGDYDDFILDQSHCSIISRIFNQIGAKTYLLDHLNDAAVLEKAFKWAIMTNDPDLQH